VVPLTGEAPWESVEQEGVDLTAEGLPQGWVADSYPELDWEAHLVRGEWVFLARLSRW